MASARLPRNEPQGCPPGEALTAHAHGEGDGAARAAIARHLLACPTCHAAHDRDAELLVALAALGAARSLPGPARRTPPKRTWTAWLPPVAAAVLVGTALLLPGPAKDGALRVEPTGPTVVMSAAHERLAPLLGAQAPDGHWAAEAGPLGAQPCAATAVVLLALLHATEGADLALRSDASVAWALQRGTGYLLDRLERPDRSLRDLPAGERALLLAALARATRVAPSARLDAATRALVSDIGRRVATAPPDHASLPWLDYALAAAEDASVPGAEAIRERLDAPGADEPGRAVRQPTRLPSAAPSEPPPCTPVRSALEMLRDEPPVRMLALGPACRSPAQLAQR